MAQGITRFQFATSASLKKFWKIYLVLDFCYIYFGEVHMMQYFIHIFEL